MTECRADLDEKRLPTRGGVYLAIGVDGEDKPSEIDVYNYPPKGGLCCFRHDYGGGPTGANDETDDHISVQFTGLEFIKRVGDFRK